MARKRDLREVDAVAAEFRLDRNEFGDFIHEPKRRGERGSKPNGDFAMDELRDWARRFGEERFGDDPNG